jgi:hypothetical protein
MKKIFQLSSHQEQSEGALSREEMCHYTPGVFLNREYTVTQGTS